MQYQHSTHFTEITHILILYKKRFEGKNNFLVLKYYWRSVDVKLLGGEAHVVSTQVKLEIGEVTFNKEKYTNWLSSANDLPENIHTSNIILTQ